VPFSGYMLSIEDLSGKVGCQVKKCSVEVLKSFLMSVISVEMLTLRLLFY